MKPATLLRSAGFFAFRGLDQNREHARRHGRAYRAPAAHGPSAVHGGLRYSIGMELIFEVRDAEEGGYFAHALGYSIFTEADTWEDLRSNVLEATSLHFEDSPVHPRLVQLHYVKDELIPVEAA